MTEKPGPDAAVASRIRGLFGNDGWLDLGMSRVYFQAITEGQQEPTLRNLVLFAEASGLTVRWFRDGTVDIEPPDDSVVPGSRLGRSVWRW
jgi:hypothetical protein